MRAGQGSEQKSPLCPSPLVQPRGLFIACLLALTWLLPCSTSGQQLQELLGSGQTLMDWPVLDVFSMPPALQLRPNTTLVIRGTSAGSQLLWNDASGITVGPGERRR